MLQMGLREAKVLSAASAHTIFRRDKVTPLLAAARSTIKTIDQMLGLALQRDAQIATKCCQPIFCADSAGKKLVGLNVSFCVQKTECGFIFSRFKTMQRCTKRKGGHLAMAFGGDGEGKVKNGGKLGLFANCHSTAFEYQVHYKGQQI